MANWFKKITNKIKLWNAKPSNSGITPLIGKVRSRIIGPKMSNYKASCLLKYNGNTTKTFDSTIKAYSRAQAVELIEKGYKVEVESVHQVKNKSKNK